MIWDQATIELRARNRGFHLITDEVLSQGPDLSNCQVGLLNLFLQHTSASLAINENADPDVRGDLERHFNVMVPEDQPHYEHVLEGPDDMPAHIKSVLVGASLTIPITAGRLALGTWQGLYLCEHRDRAGGRRVIATLQGRW
ncbi:secondary thiamine-phosphate synthase enzyme YjbQ [Marinobacter salicampi]|uniref:secondary thiamine-phosphate synthase enzyme YjbQ n=1 Tax=Marinobacter salicampi TaxID=435907 RepID=UPI00140A1F18|nr:secondary thiamine-phosphate synthase enzyme YjbQ [Marinobacter salicampi]